MLGLDTDMCSIISLAVLVVSILLDGLLYQHARCGLILLATAGTLVFLRQSYEQRQSLLLMQRLVQVRDLYEAQPSVAGFYLKSCCGF